MSTQKRNTIVKGSDTSVSVFLQTKNCDDVILPQDLTNKTLSLTYRNGAGVLVTIPNSQIQVINAVYGSILIPLSDTQTEELRTGFFDFDVIVEEGTDKKIWQFERQVTVTDRIR